MTVLVQRGTTAVNDSGFWTNPELARDGAPGTNTDTYAVWSQSGSFAVGWMELGGYDFSSIPAGSVINSVTLTVRQMVNNASRIPTVSFQAFDGATAIGSVIAGTTTTTILNDSGTIPATLAQLKSAGFKTRVTFTRSSSGSLANASLDHIDVSVDYTAGAPASRAKRWDGSAWVDAPLKRWDGSAWVDSVVKRWDGAAWV